MIPNDAIKNIDRGYAAILKKNKLKSTTPPLIVTLCMDESLIWGTSNKPSFMFSGKMHQFEPHQPDLAQQYVDRYYPTFSLPPTRNNNTN